jgi:tetratricopeptide (TPR) repeat protein
VLVDLALLQQALPGHADEAADTWRRCLQIHPEGCYRSRALWELGRLELQGGRPGPAREAWHRLLEQDPRSDEAPRAFARLGALLLADDATGLAEAWFAPRVGDARPDWAEAALVGLMRVRLAQGRPDDVRTLAADHARRFPRGQRLPEVRRLLEATGPR